MKKRILVVDDELDVRTFVSTLLETNGYRPITAENGVEALKKIRENKPDAVVMDIMMPQESGVLLYRDLKTDEHLKNIPVIVVSAVAQKTFNHSQKMLDTYQGTVLPPPDVYIEKPVESDELLQTLKGFFEPKP
ncbi:MAG: response regulator [Deltaproteobacteria bacterium]|nr:response regulator [Deltaproteobacteria bacterium]